LNFDSLTGRKTERGSVVRAVLQGRQARAVHEAEGVVQFSLLKEHLTEQIIKSGLVETRLHSLDYDAFMAGFVACCLDLMEVSTCLIENLLDENDNELDTDGGHSRECIVKEDLTVEGLDVCAIIDCFSGNT